MKRTGKPCLAMLAFCGDPVCIPASPHPAFFSSFVKSGDPPYFLPLFQFTHEIWVGRRFYTFWNRILAGSAARLGSLSLNLNRNFLSPVSCSLILEPCLRQRAHWASKGLLPVCPWGRSGLEYSGSCHSISHSKSWSLHFPNFRLVSYLEKKKTLYKMKTLFMLYVKYWKEVALLFCIQTCFIHRGE